MGETLAELETRLGDQIQDQTIPLNPAAALEKAAATRGLLPASRDVHTGDHVVQAIRHPYQRDTQHIAYMSIGDWGNVRWFQRRD